VKKKKAAAPPPPPTLVPTEPGPKLELDAATAEKVRLADLSNVIKKVKSGKPLSKYERGLIDAAQPPRPAGAAAPPEDTDEIWVSSYEKLGAIFGLHRASFPRINRDHPDAPSARQNGDHHVPSWRLFFADHPDIRRQEEAPPEETDIKKQILLQELRELVHLNDVREGKYVLVTFLVDKLTAVATEQKSILREQCEGALPSRIAGGLNADDVRTELRRVVDDICNRMGRLIDELLRPGPDDPSA
jgi:hypothetical protein